MAPNIKAFELYAKFKSELAILNGHRKGFNPFAQKCAAVCCDEIIASYEQSKKDSDLYREPRSLVMNALDSITYWKSVKEEVEKLTP